YTDHYDHLTVENCRNWERICIEGEEFNPIKSSLSDFILYFVKGEEYVKKEETIERWMQRDRELDSLLENAEPPELVRCSTCGSRMNFKDKHLWGSDDRVLFFFECPNKCIPNR